MGHLPPVWPLAQKHLLFPKMWLEAEFQRKTSPGWPQGRTGHQSGLGRAVGPKVTQDTPYPALSPASTAHPSQEPASGLWCPGPPSPFPEPCCDPSHAFHCLFPPSGLAEASLLSRDTSSPHLSSENTELASHTRPAPVSRLPRASQRMRPCKAVADEPGGDHALRSPWGLRLWPPGPSEEAAGLSCSPGSEQPPSHCVGTNGGRRRAWGWGS